MKHPWFTVGSCLFCIAVFGCLLETLIEKAIAGDPSFRSQAALLIGTAFVLAIYHLFLLGWRAAIQLTDS